MKKKTKYKQKKKHIKIAIVQKNSSSWPTVSASWGGHLSDQHHPLDHDVYHLKLWCWRE